VVAERGGREVVGNDEEDVWLRQNDECGVTNDEKRIGAKDFMAV
jgi:hypothetical protein